LDSKNFKLLTVGHAEKVELLNCAKFRLNRSNRDMVIFIFFKMAATAISDFQNFNFSTVRKVKRVELHHCAKFCRNYSNGGRDM